MAKWRNTDDCIDNFNLKVYNVVIIMIMRIVFVSKTTIYIVRHGQSLGNSSRTFLGHTDLDLSELGYIQAIRTAEELKGIIFDKIYSSDLIRAYNTAIPHAKMRNIDIISDINLREAYAGEWEGMLVDDIIAKWGVDFFKNNWANNFGNFVFPSGESIKGAGERFFNEIMNISAQNEGKTILICAHAAVIRSFWAIISDISFDELAQGLPFPTNASYSICIYENGKIVPVSYSNDGHLSDVGITKVNLI